MLEEQDAVRCKQHDASAGGLKPRKEGHVRQQMSQLERLDLVLDSPTARRVSLGKSLTVAQRRSQPEVSCQL